MLKLSNGQLLVTGNDIFAIDDNGQVKFIIDNFSEVIWTFQLSNNDLLIVGLEDQKLFSESGDYLRDLHIDIRPYEKVFSLGNDRFISTSDHKAFTIDGIIAEHLMGDRFLSLDDGLVAGHDKGTMTIYSRDLKPMYEMQSFIDENLISLFSYKDEIVSVSPSHMIKWRFKYDYMMIYDLDYAKYALRLNNGDVLIQEFDKISIYGNKTISKDDKPSRQAIQLNDGNICTLGDDITIYDQRLNILKVYNVGTAYFMGQFSNGKVLLYMGEDQVKIISLY